MKDIDFIPSWYHENRQRRNWYLRRYVTILVVTGIWMIGNLIAGGIISRAYADLDSLRSSYEQGLKKVDQARKLESRLSTLIRQSRMLQQLRPRTEISPVLAELSLCIGDRVALTDLSLVQAPLEPSESSRPASPVAVQVRGGSGRSAAAMTYTDTVMKIKLAGIASDGAEVAALISRLEESEYFIQVIPVFSKNQSRLETTVTEFEIHCVVADFITMESGEKTN